MIKKVLVCVGTRPNLIKITQFESVFKKYPDLEFVLLHTGQHYDYQMNQVFFEELQIKKPDVFLGVKGKSQLGTIADILSKMEEVLTEMNPDLVMVPGDVNSSLACALAAHRLGYPVAHIESGLRSEDRTMPEELNRILIDDLSDIHLVTEPSGEQNLKKESKNHSVIEYVGNTMIDSLVAYQPMVAKSSVLEKLSLESNSFTTVTFHRPVNVDNQDSLIEVVNIIKGLSKSITVVFPVHPRTKKQLVEHGLFESLENEKNVVLTEPLGYFDFMKLVSNSKFIVTDSGGIQEETTFLQVPCLTIRPNTERPVTITEGSNTLLPLDQKLVFTEVEKIMDGTYKSGEVPALWDGKATERIVKAISGYFKN
ncbi:UDP-N-acetylglucosamine 2-epimerase (non-hydrolyzing) [Flammeovirgaceae bacterium SG7u.111]|nr:UDP-N-acetylglucosamine 2-epimerase (non-hydrolyzing) [Flammeovirgaceae bacterium SG7u.132]WPO37340.1 UDP-N-acetylglucosamine 2-epimerase (non-hydrolyzing) [Flammeovirgaceae bacterium SG7u.111]